MFLFFARCVHVLRIGHNVVSMGSFGGGNPHGYPGRDMILAAPPKKRAKFAYGVALSGLEVFRLRDTTRGNFISPRSTVAGKGGIPWLRR